MILVAEVPLLGACAALAAWAGRAAAAVPLVFADVDVLAIALAGDMVLFICSLNLALQCLGYLSLQSVLQKL